MGQSLSVASVEHARDSILLALHRARAQVKPVPTAIQTVLHAACARYDPDARGWLPLPRLWAVLQELELSETWPRPAVEGFLRHFAIESDVELGPTTSARIDYELVIDFVFFPVTSSSRSHSRSLRLTKRDLARTTAGLRVHVGEYRTVSTVAIKELVLAGESSNPRRHLDGASEDDDDVASSLLNDAPSVRRLRDRLNALRLASHANLVRYLATVESGRSLFVVQEAHAGCTLRTILGSFGPMKEATIRRYLLQLLQGLAYLHEHDLAHGYLHLDTITIDSYGLLKLSEFGIGATLRALEARARSGRDQDDEDWTRMYPPPETSAARHSVHENWGSKADVWGVGILILQMAHGLSSTLPSGGAPATVLTNARGAIGAGGAALTPPIPAAMSKGLRALVRACLHPNPRQRLTVQHVLRLPFFQLNPEQATNEILRDVCADLDASMRRLTAATGAAMPPSTSRGSHPRSATTPTSSAHARSSAPPRPTSATTARSR